VDALRIRRLDSGDPDVAALRAALDAEVARLYADVPGFAASNPFDAPGEQDMLLVAFQAGAPAGLAGLRPCGATIAELKHVYVAPRARRRGIASALLDELEATARERGYVALRLDTGARQREALSMYEARGFRRIRAYNTNAGIDVWMEKRLTG
jgi:ribosomal protein S18 acetylase RimI-like enzyme